MPSLAWAGWIGFGTLAMMVTLCTFADLWSSFHALRTFCGVGEVDAGQGGGGDHHE